jgi:uncharacterized membrane protein YhaH (DUF805 family)
MIKLFFSTQGRIARGRWWAGAVGLFAFPFALMLVWFFNIGFSIMSAPMGSGMEVVAQSFLKLFRAAGSASLVLFAVLAYPFYCLSAKRRHDLDKEAWDVIGCIALTLLVCLLQALGVGFTTVRVDTVMVPTIAPLFSALQGLQSLAWLYLLVVLGILAGQPGPNAHGPDPLGRQPTAIPQAD